MAVTALTRLPDAEPVIVGGPPPELLDADPEVLRLRDVARPARVADRVRLTGAVAHDEVPPLLRAADVVVCPGEREPFGAVALEAMVCG
ncbi:glycosyltransferase, partial [Streptomyces sp. MUM 203J]|nr:glycosyltransferase [Streptomyces sp. MUM 203J]